VKLLFDQNLSHKLVAELTSEFPGSKHVRELGLANSDDDAIWEHAKQQGFVILSKDSDFHQKSFLLGHPPKVIWLRLGNCSTTTIVRTLRSSSAEVAEFAAHPEASFLVLP
jgi:predicted nuclease of predicted toxin-antitoxin system